MFSIYYKDYPGIYSTREDHEYDFNKALKILHKNIRKMVCLKFKDAGDECQAESIMHSQLWGAIAYSKKDDPNRDWDYRINCCKNQLSKIINEVYTYCKKDNIALDMAMEYSFFNEEYHTDRDLDMLNMKCNQEHDEIKLEQVVSFDYDMDLKIISNIIDEIDYKNSDCAIYLISGFTNEEVVELTGFSLRQVKKVRKAVMIIVNEMEQYNA